MTSGHRELILLTQAEQALAKARTIDEVKVIGDKAHAAKVYATKAGLSKSNIVHASAIKVQAERRLGQILGNIPLANFSHGNQYTGTLDGSHSRKPEEIRVLRRSRLPRISNSTAVTFRPTRTGRSTVINRFRRTGGTCRLKAKPCPLNSVPFKENLVKHIINNRVIEVQEQPDGSIKTDDLRRAAGISPDRQFILQMPDGSNRIVNPGEMLSLGSSQNFRDAPEHKRG